MKDNIALVGLRGSGKSTVGLLLAKKLKFPLIDMDRELEFRKGQKIQEWVAAEGWLSFREAEVNLLEELSSSDGKIISTGGGAILNEASRKRLREKTKCFYLHWQPSILAARIDGDSNRPRLKGEGSLVDEMAKLYEERDNLYRECGVMIEHQGTENVEWTLAEILRNLGAD